MSPASVRRVCAALVGVLLATGLVACSGEDSPAPSLSTSPASPTSQSASTSPNVSTSPASSASPSASASPRTSVTAGASASPGSAAARARAALPKPVTVTDVNGVVRLPAPARRVVALDWTYAEDLLAVGVRPVGVADKAGYAAWVGGGPRLDHTTAEVGPRQQPDPTAVRALRPDLILVGADETNAVVAQMRKIAPVLVFDPYRPDMSAWTEMRTTFAAVARAVGRTDQAAWVLRGLDDAIARDRSKLAAAGAANLPVALAQGYSVEGVPTIRMFGRTSLAGDLLGRLGLQNDWRGEPDRYGLSTVGPADLGQVSTADFLYLADPRSDIFTGAMTGRQDWRGLAFVAERRVHRLGARTWFFGGPLSTRACADALVRALGRSS
ncbi:iron complex transport system substrate-binding protein [Actinopolymorpha singaporensis]|uniref:Iron complex transport system substrate-binding protein n=1 Tax=Actinopolymorpha singaporensis TaxID=117157 RepID=A0A1H1Y3W3_9ACTN|nr:iron complex transport system substrate-binding protein [Actinopolymorpha singaporensis]